MKTITDYCLLHIKWLLLIVFSNAMFCLVLFLYQYPVEPILYAASLVYFVVFLTLGYDFIIFRRKKQQLLHCKQNIQLKVEDLPISNIPLEKQYQELIILLDQERINEKTEFDKKISEANDYYSMWVHQIKTPIQAMRLLLQSEQSEKEETLEQLFKIEEYVSMVLQYLKTENLFADLHLGCYALDPLIKQSLRKYANLFIRKHITLHYVPFNATVVTDEKWFSFILDQLLSNALKYTVAGSVTICLEANQLIIQDTGMGVKEEDLPRICEKGFTGFNGHADKKSSGIGLYLCKQMSEHLGHHLTFESKFNEGFTAMMNLNQYKIH